MRVFRVVDFLNRNHIKHKVIRHSRVYTSLDIAESAHISGKELAKTVMAKIDGKIAMVVLPASQKIDFTLLKEVTGAKETEIASEEEFQDMFSECEVGAMPPLGNLYGMDVYVDKSLTDDKEIAFNAGNHMELVQISYKDFEDLVKPKRVNISYH